MEIREYTEYSRDEIQRLYSQVGWTAYTEDLKALEQGFKNSLLVLASFENDELLGIIRVVGDGIHRYFGSGYSGISSISKAGYRNGTAQGGP